MLAGTQQALHALFYGWNSFGQKGTVLDNQCYVLAICVGQIWTDWDRFGQDGTDLDKNMKEMKMMVLSYFV